LDQDSYELGCEAVERQDLAAAERHLRRAAEHGHDEAGYRLAMLLLSRVYQLRLTGLHHQAARLAAEADGWLARARSSGLAEAMETAADTPSKADRSGPGVRPAAVPPDGYAGTAAPALARTPVPEVRLAGATRFSIGVELRPHRYMAVLADER